MKGLNRRSFFATTSLAATAPLVASSAWLNTSGDADADTIAGTKEKLTTVWQTADKQRVWGYVLRHSILPGESFDIMLSAGPDFAKVNGKIQISRIGDYKDDRKLVWSSHPLTIKQHAVQVTSASMGTDWPSAVGHINTEEWESGYYTIDFVFGDGEDQADFDIAYMVVRNPKRSGDVVVCLSTNTYNAYNSWGGYSFYDSMFVGTRAQMLSFDRPAAKEFYEYDYHLVVWLEKLAATHGFKVDYVTNFDIYNDKDNASYSKLLISGCHNEYWSQEEFDAVHNRIFKEGKNTIFFGANTAYWRVRYTDVCRSDAAENWGRQLICYKSTDDPISRRGEAAAGKITTRFRHEGTHPETMLCGVGFQSYFEPGDETGPQYPYKVVNAQHPLFKDTGWSEGQAIGDVVGYEWDNRDPHGDGKRLWHPGLSKIPAIEEHSIEVLFQGHPINEKGHASLAEAVYFKSSAGARVFSTGSIRWSWGLGKAGYQSEAFRTFNRNVVMSLIDRA